MSELKVIITITDADVVLETENLEARSLPKLITEAYLSLMPTLLKDSTMERMYTELLENMDTIITRYERHTSG